MNLLKFVAALVGRSVEGPELANSTDKDKCLIFNDATEIIECLPEKDFIDEGSYAVLGYLISCSLLVIGSTKKQSKSLQTAASKFLSILLKRLAQNIKFIESITPNTCSKLLNLFVSWEKEPRELLENVLGCLRIVLVQGANRIQNDNKVGSIVNTLCQIAEKLAANTELLRLFSKILVEVMSLAQFTFEIDYFKSLVLAYAFIIGKLQEQEILFQDHPEIIRIALDCLQKIIDELPGTFTGKNFETSCIRVTGLLELIPKPLWPNLAILEEFLDAFLAKRLKSWQTNISPQIEDLALYRDESTKPLANLYRIIGFEGFLDRHLEFSAADLVSLSHRVKNQTISSQIMDVCLNSFISYEERILHTNVNILEASQEEQCWYMAWCFLITVMASHEIDQSDVPLLLEKLITLRGFPSFAIRDASEQALSRLAIGCNFKDSEDMISRYYASLLNQVLVDLRFPALYPTAPLQLSYLLRIENQGLPSLNLLPLLRDLEELIADFRAFPSYILSVLQSLASILDKIQDRYTAIQAADDDEEDKRPLPDQPHSIEQSLAASMICCALHFVTDEQTVIRMAALQVLYLAIGPFAAGEAKDNGYGAILPLIHQTWQPLIGRLSDSSIDIIMLSLSIISRQSRIAGEFMRDRIQRQFLGEAVGNIMSNPGSLCQKALPLILEIIQNSCANCGSRSLRDMAIYMVKLVTSGNLSLAQAYELFGGLAAVDGDLMYYVLVGMCSNFSTISRANFRPIALSSFKKDSIQPDFISRVLEGLQWHHHLQ